MWQGRFEIGAAELFGCYLAALDRGDLAAIDALFTPDAEVISPLYGAMNAADYHRILLADTDRTRPRLCNIFDHANNGRGAAAHLQIAWTLADQETVEFEAVDLVELADDGRRFRKLTVVYDSTPVRAAWLAFRERQMQRDAASIVMASAGAVA
jgi:ketosteroid isomerase-like protein